MKIAYLGLGVIGSGMCSHLVKKFDLAVWNRTASKMKPFEELGARAASSPADAANGADVVCVCVADTPDVEAVVFGESGAAAGIGEGTLLIDFSTISAQATEEFAARLEKERGARWIDAPVSGGDVGARNGTLTIMAGGAQEDYDRVASILETVGKKIERMGPVGSGQRTKMANQIAVCGTIASMAEALNFAREKGMDLQKVFDVISSGAAGSWSLSNYGPRLLKGDYDPGFAASLMAKDLRIVLEALEGLESDYSTVKRLADVYEAMVAEGQGGLGNHAAALRLGWKKPP